jgi:hypothetical protein
LLSTARLARRSAVARSPVTLRSPRSTDIKPVSVPPVPMRRPSGGECARTRIVHDRLIVKFELGPKRLAEAGGFAGDALQGLLGPDLCLGLALRSGANGKLTRVQLPETDRFFAKARRTAASAFAYARDA